MPIFQTRKLGSSETFPMGIRRRQQGDGSLLERKQIIIFVERENAF